MKSLNQNSFDICIWASDFREFTGEGLLARCFIKEVFTSKHLAIKIYSNFGQFLCYKNQIFKLSTNIRKENFISKYLFPIYGIYILWCNYYSGKKICYLNYLPLWNFIIFLLLPKETILGPITGYIFKKRVNSIETFIRKYIFNFFYSISLKIIFRKFKFLIFSTNNLEKLIPKDKKKKCLFNFCLLFFQKRKLKKKNIDIVFYIRKHSQKSNDIQNALIKKLCKFNFRVVVVGEHMKNNKIINYPNINRDHLLKILDRAKFAIASDENFYSLFALDCVSSNVLIFFNKKIFNKNIPQFIPINFENEVRVEFYKSKIFKQIKKFNDNKRLYKFNIYIKKKRKSIQKKLNLIVKSYL